MRDDSGNGGWLRRVEGYHFTRFGVIPPGTRVDPARFPEAEFPLICPGCDYLLAGLPDNTCPECGRAFDRGQLLVRQYVIKRGRRHQRLSGTRAWVNYLVVALVVFNSLIVPLCGYFFPRYMLTQTQRGHPISTWPLVLAFSLVVIVNAGVLVAVLTNRRPQPAYGAMARRVFDAVDHRDPVFLRVQRWRWVPFFVLIPPIIVLGVVIFWLGVA